MVNDLSQAVYYAATGNFKLVVNWKKSNEIKVLMISQQSIFRMNFDYRLFVNQSSLNYSMNFDHGDHVISSMGRKEMKSRASHSVHPIELELTKYRSIDHLP